MANFAPPIAVFDLDGTLADTAGDLVATLNVILDQEGLPPLPVEKARDMIGAGARALIERGFESEGRDLAPDHLEGAVRALHGPLRRQYLRHDHAFSPASRARSTGWKRRDFILAICTNKVEAHSVKLLAELGIGHRFAFNAGRDTFPYFKPDARHI